MSPKASAWKQWRNGWRWGVIDSDRVRRMFSGRDPAGFMDPNDLAETIVSLAKRSARAWVREVIVRAPSAVD